MNQTTRPRRDPPGEHGNKRSSLKRRQASPGPLGTRGNNVSVEFPLWLFQTGEETRSFQDRRRISSSLLFPSLPRFQGTGWMRGGREEEEREPECWSSHCESNHLWSGAALQTAPSISPPPLSCLLRWFTSLLLPTLVRAARSERGCEEGIRPIGAR